MKSLNATRVNASTFGVLSGLAGMEHGFFETLQGSVATAGLVIEAIGPAHRFWPLGTEIAFSVLPNYLLSGLLSMAFGLAIIIWSGLFIEKRYGALILAMLTVLLFLSGGGFAPAGSAIVAVIAAANINRSHSWWGHYLPEVIQRFLASTWKVALIAVVVLYLFCLWSAIFGWPLTRLFDAMTVNNTLLLIGQCALGLMFYLIPAGFAYDLRNAGGQRFVRP